MAILVVVAAVVIFVAAVVASLFLPERQTGDGGERSVGWHSAHGTHQVYYPDCNAFSQPFTYDVAQDYASLFNGMVVPLGFEHENNPRSRMGRAKLERERKEREAREESQYQQVEGFREGTQEGRSQAVV